VGGALASEAERIYQHLAPEQQLIARRVFLGLVQLGEGTSDTRRRVPIAAVATHQVDRDRVHEVIDRFAETGSRLITVSADPDGTDTAEVTHEALFEHWQQLRQWVDGNREGIRFHRRLEEAAQHWEEEGRPEGLLWRQPDLGLLWEFAGREPDSLSGTEYEFLEAAAARDARDRQRQRRRMKLAVAAAVMFAFIGSLACYFGYRSQTQLGRNRQLVYALEMREAQQAWESGDIARLQYLLDKHQPRAGEDRGRFEWIYLNSLRRANLARRICTFDDRVREVVVSPEGGIVVGLRQKGVFSVDPNTGARSELLPAVEQLWSPEKRGAIGDAEPNLYEIQISRDGKLLAITIGHYWKDGGNIGEVILWDMLRGIELFRLPGERAAFSPDNQILASGQADGSVTLWDLESGEMLDHDERHSLRVSDLTFSSDGTILLTGSYDRKAILRELENGHPVRTFGESHHSYPIMCVALEPLGRFAATSTMGRGVNIWDLSTSAASPIKILPESWPCQLNFSPTGDRLAVTTLHSCQVSIYGTESWEKVATLNQTSKATACAYMPSSSQLVVGCEDGSLWIQETTQEISQTDLRVAATGHPRLPASDIGTVAVGDRGGIWLFSDGSFQDLRWGKNTDNWIILPLFLSATGEKLVYAYGENFRTDSLVFARTVGILDLTTNTRRDIVKRSAGEGPLSAALTPDERHLYVGGPANKIEVFDLVDGSRRTKQVLTAGNDVKVLCFDCDNTKLAVGGGPWADHGIAKVWDLTKEPFECLGTVKGYEFTVFDIAFSPDGNLLAIASHDGRVTLWHSRDGSRRELINTGNSVRCVTFDTSGKTLAVATIDGFVRLCDVASGVEMLRFDLGEQMGAVQFVQGGNTHALVCQTREGSVYVFDVAKSNPRR
jgi:WD40 repeat protein